MRKLVIATVAMSIAMSATAQSSNWKNLSNVDPLTDKETLSAVSSINDYTALFVFCGDTGIAVAAVTGLLDIELEETRSVSWRIDDEAAVTQQWANLQKRGAILRGTDAEYLAGHCQRN